MCPLRLMIRFSGFVRPFYIVPSYVRQCTYYTIIRVPVDVLVDVDHGMLDQVWARWQAENEDRLGDIAGFYDTATEPLSGWRNTSMTFMLNPRWVTKTNADLYVGHSSRHRPGLSGHHTQADHWRCHGYEGRCDVFCI